MPALRFHIITYLQTEPGAVTVFIRKLKILDREDNKRGKTGSSIERKLLLE